MKVKKRAKKFAKKHLYKAMRNNPTLRKQVRKGLRWKRTRHYREIADEIPMESNHVMFCSFKGRSFSCSPRALFEAMQKDERFKDFHYYWAFGKGVINNYRWMEEEYPNVTLVKYASRAHLEAYARSKYWIINSVTGNYLEKKPGQVYVQCWHGTPLKRLGMDIVKDTTSAMSDYEEIEDRYRTESEKWDYFVSPSRFTSECLISSFGVPEDEAEGMALEIGYPRNDAIVNTVNDPEALAALKERMIEELGIPRDKKLLLYAPTWRDNEYKEGVGYVQDVMVDFDLLKEELSDEWAILFRPHYFVANSFDFEKYGDFVVNAAAVPDINELYCIADVLMTDYSSVFFDYACTKRPLIFYMPDLDQYANEVRGFYLDPVADLPGPHCGTSQGVVDAVKGIDSYFDEYGEAYKVFQERFCPMEDGKAALRLADAIFGK